MTWLSPDRYVTSVLAIDLDELQSLGIKGMLIDLDNTLLARDKDIVEPEIEAWIEEVKSRGIKICLVSNNWHERVTAVAKQLDVEIVCKAVKPLPMAFLRALKILGVKRREAVVVGDQLFTDVLGGRFLGITTVMVLPLAAFDLAHTLFLRKIERHFLKDRVPEA